MRSPPNAVFGALQAARGRHVMVRLVLEQQPYGMGSYAADPAYNFLQTYVGQVRWGGQLAFRYTHASYLVADGARTFIGSMSWTDTGLGANRELGLIDTDPRVASAGERVFNADWNQRKLHSAPNAVVVSPDGARARILKPDCNRTQVHRHLHRATHRSGDNPRAYRVARLWPASAGGYTKRCLAGLSAPAPLQVTIVRQPYMDARA